MKHCAVCLLIVVGLTVGCGKIESSSSTLARGFNVAGAPTVEFSVPDMMCPDGCGAKTKEILSKVPGAVDVYVDFDTKTATVAIEEGKFDAEQAVAALVDHGFDHSAVKRDAAADQRTAPQTAVLPASN